MQPGEGERLHAAKRKRFWAILGGLAVVGLAGGFVGTLVLEHADGGQVPEWTTPVAAVGVIIVALLAAAGSWKFFVDVDELELADNLWGSLVGYYWYAILFPAWWALNKLGQVPDVDHWAIFFSSMIVALAVYFYRKWRLS